MNVEVENGVEVPCNEDKCDLYETGNVFAFDYNMDDKTLWTGSGAALNLVQVVHKFSSIPNFLLKIHIRSPIFSCNYNV